MTTQSMQVNPGQSITITIMESPTVVQSGGGGGGANVGLEIIPTPSTLAAPTGALAGASVGSLAMLDGDTTLTGAVFSTTNPKFQFTGAEMQTGGIETDYTQKSTENVLVRAQSADGNQAVEQTFTVTVTPAGGPDLDFNFVTDVYVGGASTDVTCTQANSYAALWNDGRSTTFPPNTLRRTDLGVDCSAVSVDYIGLHSQDPLNWNLTNGGGSNTSVVAAPSEASTDYPNPVQLQTSYAGNGYEVQPWAEDPAVGTAVTIKVGFKKSTAPGANLGIAWLESDGVTWGGESWTIQDLAGLTGSPPVVNVNTGNANGIHTSLISCTQAADGWVTLIIQYTVQGTSNSCSFKLGGTTDGTPNSLYLGGSQVVTGIQDKPWKAITTAMATDQADVITPSGLFNTIANAASGTLGFEVGNIPYGQGGVIAGDILSVGSTHAVKAETPTTVSANGQVTALGISGFRGLVRCCLSWDSSGWSLWANGGKAASGTGALPNTGVPQLMNGLSGRLRRITGWVAKQPDTACQRWSSIENKTFTNPGDALIPGLPNGGSNLNITTETFYDDFDVPSLKTHGAPYTWPEPGQTGEYSSDQISDIYKPSWQADSRKRWIPRSHFYRSPTGQGAAAQINQEPEYYRDPEYTSDGSAPGTGTSYNDPNCIEFVNSDLVLHCVLTSSLPAAQQSAIPIDPNTGSTFRYASAEVTTWAAGAGSTSPLDGGGFWQQFGIFNFRAKLPAIYGAWGALWTYQYNTTELDLEEYYGVNPDYSTCALHSRNFAYNDGSGSPGISMGFVLGDDYHDFTYVWQLGYVDKYIDGVKVKRMTTEPAFDYSPMWILMNIAFQPGIYNTSTDDDLNAGKGVLKCDRVRVLQFS